MEKILLRGEKRKPSEHARILRASKIIPAVIYGRKQETMNIKLKSSDVSKAYRLAGENHILELEIDGKKIDVLFHDIQKDPVTDNIIHVDFYAISKDEKVHTHIPLKFVGVSKAKTDEGAIIEELIKEVEVKCLPADLVDSIEVDLSLLERIGDNIKISQLKISSKIEILNHQDEVVATAAKSKDEKDEDSASTSEISSSSSETKATDE